jgi:3-deoxy-D-manno-octulosonic-acid transferase
MGIAHDIVYAAAALVSSPVWVASLLRTGKWRTDWAGKLGRCDALPRDGRPTLLIHAVSVGEANLIKPLVDTLAEQSAREGTPWRIVVCTTTNTGFARAKQVYSPAHTVVRYPLDFTFAVSRFLNAVQPDVVALTELEVWPNFVAACVKRDVPVCVINGRLSARSFSRYRLITPLLRQTFASLSAVAAQTPDYAARFVALGSKPERVKVLDTMKWDTAQITDEVAGAAELATAMGIDRAKPLVVAGSTAPGEEKMLIDALPAGAQLLLVPRKPEWFDLVSRHVPTGQTLVRRTSHPDGKTRSIDSTRFFLLDTIGELRKAYALADVVVIGRSFVKLGGSDLIEPIGLGKATIIGPFHANFSDAVAAFRERDGVVVTDEPGPAIVRLLGDPSEAKRIATAGRDVIRQRQGSTQRHAQMIRELMAMRQARASGVKIPGPS